MTNEKRELRTVLPEVGGRLVQGTETISFGEEADSYPVEEEEDGARQFFGYSYYF